MTKLSKPTLENKRKLADVVIEEYPELDPPSTRLRKKIGKRMSQFDKSIVTAKDGGYHAEHLKETRDSFADNEATPIPQFFPISHNLGFCFIIYRLYKVE
jgi:hypothetical protein